MTSSLRPLALATLLTALLAAPPAFAEPLQDYDGTPRALAEFTGNGQWTVVKIWASDCHLCNEEAHAYVAFHDAHAEDDARMLGISIDGTPGIEAARAFIDRHGLDYPNLLTDYEGGNTLYTELTGVPLAGTPAFLVYNPEGELLAQQVGAVPVELLERFIATNGGG